MSIKPHIPDRRFAALFKDTFGFDNREYSLLLSCFTVKKIAKKDFYFKPGTICMHKAYVNKGCLRNYVIDEHGHERVLFFPVEDWWTADIDSYYSAEPGTNYIQALEDCELLEISKENFVMLETKIPKLNQWYTYKLTRKVMNSVKRIEEMKTLSPQERYINLLKSNPQIVQRVPLQHIASYLNIEPQSLSRMRKRLSKNF